jgi:hypothetical protein
MAEPSALRRTVFSCTSCAPLGLGFTRPSPDKAFFKFPPTIGAFGSAPLLFVGINPRFSGSNHSLHALLMSDPSHFDVLSQNKNPLDHLPYVSRSGAEGHYHPHAEVAERVFPGKRFAEVAAVTELFLCASENATGVGARILDSPCAERFMEQTVAQVSPRVIIPVGKMVLRYFRDGAGRRFEHRVPVVPMSHPNAYGSDKQWSIEWTIDAVKAVLESRPLPQEPLAQGRVMGAALRSEDSKQTQGDESGALSSDIVKRVDNIPPGAYVAAWNLNQRTRTDHHGAVPRSRTPLYLNLGVRKDAGPPDPVGMYRLDLTALLRAGFIRTDPAGDPRSSMVRVRVAIVRGRFCLQVNGDSQPLWLPGPD